MTDDAVDLRARLEKIVQATPRANVVQGFWVGHAAGKRQVMDNLQSGRLHWQGARDAALQGLEALASGDVHYAELALREAILLRAAALEAQVKPDAYSRLTSDAGMRGRPTSTEVRNVALAEAVADKERNGLSGIHAREAAIKESPQLQKAFSGKGDRAIRNALEAGRKMILERK